MTVNVHRAFVPLQFQSGLILYGVEDRRSRRFWRRSVRLVLGAAKAGLFDHRLAQLPGAQHGESGQGSHAKERSPGFRSEAVSVEIAERAVCARAVFRNTRKRMLADSCHNQA
jgi:hypothetical protein